MRSARNIGILLVVLLVSLTAMQLLIEEARAVESSLRAEEDQALRDLLIYSGPDPEIQFESIRTLSELLGYQVSPVHEQIIRHQNLTQFGSRDQDLTLAFRGLGKSSVGTTVRAIAYVLRDVNVRILIASHTTGAAEEIHQEIHDHLVENQTLVRLFGDFYHDSSKSKIGRYSDKRSTIMQRTKRTLKEGTFNCLGVGKQGASRHFDVEFVDDIVVEQSSLTATKRKNLRNWIGSTLIGTTLPHTRTHGIGTRYMPGDYWDELVNGTVDEGEGYLKDATLVIPMVENFGDPMEQWIPTHPERYDLQACIKRYRTMGRYHFLAQMQQDTSSGSGIIFCYPDFRWWTPTENAPPAGATYFQYSDLAAKRTESGDYFVNITMAVADVHGERRIWVVDFVRMRGGLHQQRESIVSQIGKWKPVRAGVEAVAMQAGFAQEIAEGTLLPVRACPEGRQKKDKEFEGRRVSFLVEGHHVYLPAPDTALGRKTKPLVDELSVFPENTDHDDAADAFIGCLDLIAFGDFFRGLGDFYAAGQSEALALNGVL